MNFIKGQQVKLSDLFKPGTRYLSELSDFSRKKLKRNKNLDEHLIIEGTKPIVQNYQTWYFTCRGIAIVFNTYQVAAYVYGEQIAEIHESVIADQLKPEVSKMVWGN